jgi:hypothetical protein
MELIGIENDFQNRILMVQQLEKVLTNGATWNKMLLNNKRNSHKNEEEAHRMGEIFASCTSDRN